MNDASAPAARTTRLGRVAVYLAEQFPPWAMVPTGVGMFLGGYWGLEAMAAPAGPLPLTWRAGAGALTIVLVLLIMRVYDELKDVETDLRLGRAGDPRYVDRPIVTGRLQVGDLVALRWAVTALMVGLNLPLGWPWPGVAFLAVFGFAWLSFKWFFWPAIQKNLLLAFATHNPLTGVMLVYVGAVWWADPGAAGGAAAPPAFPAAGLAVGLWFPIAAWETSRKVRIPADETDYQTYSMLLGWRVAATVPVVFVGLSAVGVAAAARAAGLGPAYLVALAVGAAAPTLAALRLHLAPSTRAANLRPWVEVYGLVVNVGLPVALALDRGVVVH